jgi:hypothetical protein
MTLAKDSAVYYPERYYYSLSNLDAFALSRCVLCDVRVSNQNTLKRCLRIFYLLTLPV